MIRCPDCSADNPEHARFCNQCGARFASATVDATSARSAYTPRHLIERVLKDRSALIGERKRVTVVFADIKNSTRLAEQAGAEVWHGVLDRFFGLLAHTVHRYEGTVNQYTGDGIMALFGAPVAHEDHALRACHAAQEMQAAVCAYAMELQGERGLDLKLRIGVNTGEVVVGRIGDDLRMDYTAQGVTVNLAARLEQLCEPGQIYLSRSTANWVDGRFRLRALGATQVNGLDLPVEIFALEDRVEALAPMRRRLGRGSGFFVGRETELARLNELFIEAASGQGRVLALSGAAGMGKSRLCHEFLAAAELRGVIIHRTAASPYARHQPMSAMRALYLSRIGCSGVTDPAQLRAAIETDIPASVLAKPGALAFVLEFAGIGQPGALHESLAAVLREPMMRALAHYLPRSDQPQILLFEDVHHLDPIALDFVRQLVAEVAGTPTLLLLTWRSDAAPGLLSSVDECIALAPLNDEAVTRLASEWLGSDPSVQALVRRITDRAGGNPFFVEEAITALAETGHLQGLPAGYRLAQAIDAWPIPDTVHALIAARIDRLPARLKRLLQAAAVIGSDFDAALLAEIDDEAADTEASLTALEQTGIIRRETDSRRWHFDQPLLREVAYGMQLEAARAGVHARLAQALERNCGDKPVHPAARAIAEHWALAGEWAQAGRWNLHAAIWFAARDARITAEMFHGAKEHLDRAPFSIEVRRMRIAARAGLIRMALLMPVEPEYVDRAYHEAQRMAEECGDPLCSAELSISFGNEQLHRGLAERAMHLIESGLRECPAESRADLANRFRVAVLMAYGSAGKMKDGLELVNGAGGDAWLTGPISNDNSLSRAFVSVHLAWGGELCRAQQDLDTAIRLTESDGRSASWMHGQRVELAWFSGCSEGVIAEADRALEQAEAFGSLFFRALALRSKGQALCLLGRHAEAIEPLMEARPLAARGAGAYQVEAHLLAVLSEACLGAGRVDEALRHSADGVISGRASGVRIWELRAWIARLGLAPGALDDASLRAGFQRARELVRDMQAHGVAPRLDELQARHESDPDRSLALIAQAVEGYERIGAGAHAQRLRLGARDA